MQGPPVAAEPSVSSQRSNAVAFLDSDRMQGAASGNRARIDPKAFMPERVGIEISKRYDIDQHEIGAGGYGKVFVAKDREMKGRLVAIKKVIIFDEEKKKAFQKEVEIMKDLDHPNICKLLETYEHGRFMYFVMEYCEGREVFDRIMEHGMIAEQTTADIVKQSASALKYAHNRGIAHRDMKPENICFCNNDVKDNQVKVIDWGLGFYFGQARMSSAVGSLTYAAPEVLEARELDGYSQACDLWSLGVVTYVMLCGKPPFWGNYAEQLKRMKKEQYPMQDSTWQAISKEAKDLIKGLLKNNAKDRLPLDAVMKHAWLKNASRKIDPEVGHQVLCNLRQFSKTSQFFSLCVASVARQLDHRSLRDVHRVFCEMDTNGDGVLELHEVRAGFEKIFGKNSEQVRDVDDMFARLDLDGSGQIDYTEFCAAGIGERRSTEEDVLWAAFKSFDIQDDDGKITKEEIKQVLLKADVNKFWTSQVCDELSNELFSRFDTDNDGSLDFEEFLRLMRQIASRHMGGPQAATNPKEGEERLMAELQKTNFSKAYGILDELDRKAQQGVSPGKRVVVVEPDQEDKKRGGGGSSTPGLRTVSGSVANFMRDNTPACFTCSSDSRGQPCVVM